MATINPTEMSFPFINSFENGRQRHILALNSLVNNNKSFSCKFITTQPTVIIQSYNAHVRHWFSQMIFCDRQEKLTFYLFFTYMRTNIILISKSDSKVSSFIKSVFFFFFLAMPHSMWDLSCLTRDQTCALCSEWKNTVSTAGPPGKSLRPGFMLINLSSNWQQQLYHSPQFLLCTRRGKHRLY